MPPPVSKIQFSVACRLGLLLGCLMMAPHSSEAEDYSFSNSLAQAAVAEKNLDVPGALKIYNNAALTESKNSAGLCVLARKYCDLMYLTKSTDVLEDLARRALDCSLEAVKADSNNATAHACVAVCYAKNSEFADVKTKITYSRQIKIEAEKTVALDPKQDIGYYLLGRWNYGVANMGMVSRAFVRLVYGGLPAASNEEAVAEYKKAIEVTPDRIINHAGLAEVYETMGEEKLEIAELKKCRDLKPISFEDRDAQRDAIKKLAALGQ